VLEKRVLYSRAIFLYIGRVFLWGLGWVGVRLDWVGWRFYGDFSVGPSILYTFVEIFGVCRGVFFWCHTGICLGGGRSSSIHGVYQRRLW